MYKNILVCTDGSKIAQQAASHGIKLAASVNARVIALLVTTPFEAPLGYEVSPLAVQIEQHQRASEQIADRILGAIEKQAKAKGVRCKTLHIGRYPPAATIVATARDQKCDLIVMGSHGHGALGQLLLGSVTTRVAATSPIPLLIVRAKEKAEPPATAKKPSNR